MSVIELTLIAICALIAMGLVWVGVLWLLAWVSGWRALARRFEAEREPPGRCFSMASGGLGLVRFNGALRVWVSEKGIGLGCLLPAFGAMPRLLLPWRSIVSIQPHRFLFVSMVRIKVNDWSSWISLRGAAGDAALAAWQARQSAKHR